MVKHVRDVHPEEWTKVKVSTIKMKAGKKEVERRFTRCEEAVDLLCWVHRLLLIGLAPM